MSISKQKKILNILLPVLVALLGVAYIVAVAHLYFTGDSNPYSREVVGRYLTYLAIPSAVTLIAVIWGGVISYLSAGNDGKAPVFTAKTALCRLNATLALDKCSDSTKLGILSERKKRKILFISAVVLSVAYTAVALIFALGAEYTLENPNASVIGVLVYLLPLTAVIIGIIYVVCRLFQSSIASELKLVKTAIKDGARDSAAFQSECASPLSGISAIFEEHEEKIYLGLKITVFAVDAVFIVLGIVNGGMADVLGKAVRICTECIGLG